MMRYCPLALAELLGGWLGLGGGHFAGGRDETTVLKCVVVDRTNPSGIP